jgi:DnaD/phage-associated family protein
MTTYSWIKLYHEILNDPKMGQLPDYLWRRAIELFLLAGKNGNDGALSPVEDMVWTLRPITKDKLIENLQNLAEVGIVYETEPGKWVVTNFSKRQSAITPTERSREFQKRKRNDYKTKRFTDENEAVVELSSSSSVSKSSSDSVEDDRGVGEGETSPPNVFTVYQSNIGMLTPMIRDSVADAEQTYSADWVIAAIQEAVASNARSWKYCEAILSRWKRDGFKSSRPGKVPPGETVEEHNRRVVKELVYGNAS